MCVQQSHPSSCYNCEPQGQIITTCMCACLWECVISCKPINNHVYFFFLVCVCVDGTARGTSVWFPRAHPVIRAQVFGSSKRTGISEKCQCTGPTPAHRSCLASAVNQPCYCSTHTAEGTSRGQRHTNAKENHKYTRLYLSLALLFLCPTHSHLHSVISCVVLQTFLVRKSRTSQRNVLCVRLADDSVPSFVQQFGIREELSSKNLKLLNTDQF